MAGLDVLEADERDDVEVVASYDPVPAELAERRDEIEAAITDELRSLDREDLLGDVDSGWILFSGPGAGVSEEALAPYRELLEQTGKRIVVTVGPPP